MRSVAVLVFLVTLTMGPSARAVTVSEYLERADKLPKNWVMAQLKKEGRALSSEFSDILKTIRAEDNAAKAANGPRAFCLPRSASLRAPEVIQHFHALPPDKRNVEVKQALEEWFVERYPCGNKGQDANTPKR